MAQYLYVYFNCVVSGDCLKVMEARRSFEAWKRQKGVYVIRAKERYDELCTVDEKNCSWFWRKKMKNCYMTIKSPYSLPSSLQELPPTNPPSSLQIVSYSFNENEIPRSRVQNSETSSHPRNEPPRRPVRPVLPLFPELLLQHLILLLRPHEHQP